MYVSFKNSCNVSALEFDPQGVSDTKEYKHQRQSGKYNTKGYDM